MQEVPMPRPGTTTQRGYGWQWQKLTRKAFELYGRTCHICHRPGADTVDHLDPVSIVGAQLPHISRVRPAHMGCNSGRGNGELRPASSPRSEAW